MKSTDPLQAREFLKMDCLFKVGSKKSIDLFNHLFPVSPEEKG